MNSNQVIKVQTFKFDDCVGEIYKINNQKYQVKGSYTGSGSPNLFFYAASPPNYIQSFSGSGLPYPNPEIAYENTPNHKVVNLNNPNSMNQFDIEFFFPNSYYHEQGRIYVPPHINLIFGKNAQKNSVFLNEDIPARSLSVSLFNAVV
jgi:hypothetical protein